MSEADDLQRVKAQLELSRRRFLQQATILGVGAAALPLFAACSNTSATAAPSAAAVGRPQRRSVGRPQRRTVGRPQRRTVGRPQRRTVGRPSAAAPPSAAPSGAHRTLEFNAWEFQPEDIKNHLANWTKTSGVPVNLSLIPNVGYGPAIQTNLQGGATLDVYYNFTYNTGQVHRAGLGARSQGFPGRGRHAQRHVPAGPRPLHHRRRQDRGRTLLLRGPHVHVQRVAVPEGGPRRAAVAPGRRTTPQRRSSRRASARRPTSRTGSRSSARNT